MKRLNKINKKILFVLILFISIGFAYLTRDLTLSGISSIFGNTWDVHFDNVVVSNGSVEANTPVIDTDRTSVSFTVEFSTPGDFYEFTVDAVNGGSIDAMLNTFTSSELDESIANLLEYTVTYADGEELAQYQELNAGDSLTYKIRLYYKLDISEDDLPDSNIPVEITFTTDYIQADSNRIQRYAETHSLYNVLKNEAGSGGLAKKYTGEHQDSMDASKSTKDIYYYGVTNEYSGSSILEKNNVVFANHCWQMIRTTDTGGVRLLYNGEVENNQCLNTRGTHVGYYIPGYSSNRPSTILNSTYYYGTDYTYDSTTNKFILSGTVTTGEIKPRQYTCKLTSKNDSCSTLLYIDKIKNSNNYYYISINRNSHYSTIGDISYNADDGYSLAYIGYMYDNSYLTQTKDITEYENIIDSDSLSTSYWYADSYTINSGFYSLSNSYQISSTDEYSSLVGKYTLRDTSQAVGSSALYYIVSVSGSTMYYIRFNSGVSDNINYTYGSDYTDNGNGTYTINNPTTKNIKSFYNNSTDMKGKYVCKNATNNSCTDLWKITDLNSSDGFSYLKKSNTYKYANSFTWDGSKYTLKNDNSTNWWMFSDETMTDLNDKHYTCWNSSGECTTLSYVHYLRYNEQYMLKGAMKFYYINLNEGKNIEDLKNEMLYDEDINQIDSTIKVGLDAWYEKYLRNYSNYLEDTIFCYDRSESNSTTNGWNPNGGNLGTKIEFKYTNNLKCENVTDRFSTLNEKAKLNYSVGLISYSESNLLYGRYARNVSKYYWVGSPNYYDYLSTVWYVDNNGILSRYSVNNTQSGARPYVSLKPGSFYTSGNGSKESPYIINTN